jgi:hypothetical protein
MGEFAEMSNVDLIADSGGPNAGENTLFVNFGRRAEPSRDGDLGQQIKVMETNNFADDIPA